MQWPSFRRKASLAALPPQAKDLPVYDNPNITSDQMKVDLFSARGSVGTTFLNGLISNEEYNNDLQGDALLRMTDKMWRSDGECAALLTVLMLPLLEGTWYVKAASDDGADVEMGQFAQDNIFGGMAQTWNELLQFILLEYLRDGFAVVEKVYTRSDDGKIRLRKLSPRLSKTIYRWYPNQDDELDRVQQRVWRPDADGISGTYAYPVMSGEQIVVFTHMKEGNNFAGNSVYRPAYKHWFMKDQLERIACVAAERQAVGVPVFNEPPGPVQKSDRDAAMNVLASLHAHEKMGITEPAGWKFRFESAHGMDVLPLIEYHSLQIVRSVLAQFLNLDRGGSYALSLDVSSFFLQSLHAKARYIRDQFNTHVIKPLIDLNYPNVTRYPTLEVDDLDRRDVEKYMAGLAAILATGTITMNADTENALRGIIGFPDLPADATPAGGYAPTVDTDSAGKSTDRTVEQEQIAADAQYRDLREAIEVVLAERPDGVAPQAWRDVVLAQARAMAEPVAA